MTKGGVPRSKVRGMSLRASFLSFPSLFLIVIASRRRGNLGGAWDCFVIRQVTDFLAMTEICLESSARL